MCIHACKSDIPSDSPVAPCLHKPVVFRAVITVDSHGIHLLPPGYGAIAYSSLSAVCVYSTGHCLVFVEDKSSENLFTEEWSDREAGREGEYWE